MRPHLNEFTNAAMKERVRDTWGKKEFLLKDLCDMCCMLDEIRAALRGASVDVTPALLMPPSVWAPWLNLVQPGNGPLPNRYTDISILHCERLVIPLCFAKILHTVGTQYACFVVFSLLIQHHKWLSFFKKKISRLSSPFFFFLHSVYSLQFNSESDQYILLK